MQIYENISLKPFNTFGTEAHARFFTEALSPEQMGQAIEFSQKEQHPFLILGGGSNVLFVNDFKGVVIKNSSKGISVQDETEEHVLIKAAGGESWPEFVDHCVEHGWSGIENLSLIPGTVGAAPVQNIGAYGTEIKEVVKYVEVLDAQTGDLRKLTNAECAFSYRSSIFKTTYKNRYIVTSVIFELHKKFTPNLTYKPLKEVFASTDPRDITIREVSEAVKAIRRSKLPDPGEAGNAGSFFKNPVITEKQLETIWHQHKNVPFYDLDNGLFKLAAGWLIEKAGWKGRRLGDAGVHEKQALVLVNYGKATGREILDLANRIKDSVLEKFGVQLEFEVNIVGRSS
jgi:UDP-N-acetylmuramate dehydrogenase